MNRIEDKFKKKYSQQELSNDNFDTEGLWDSISDDLDNGTPIKRSSLGMYVSIILLFALISAGFIYHFLPQSSNNSIVDIATADNSITDNTSTTINNIDRIIDNPSDFNQIGSKGIKSNNSRVEESYQPLSQFENSSKSIAKDTNTKPTTKLNEKKQIAESKSNTIAAYQATEYLISNQEAMETANTPITPHNTITGKDNRATTNLEKTNPKNQTANNHESFFNKERSEKQSIENRTGVDNTNLKEVLPFSDNDVHVNSSLRSALNTTKATTLQLYPIHREFILQIEDQIRDYQDTLDPTTSKISWEVNLWGGINTLNQNFISTSLSDLATLKNQTEKNTSGKSLGLQTSIIWNNRYLLSTGIEYHDLWSKLDLKLTTPIQVWKENELINVWIDEASGDTLNTEYGKVLVDADSTRTVIHHNRYRRLSIPIELGIQHQIAKYTLGISAGAVLNFTRFQSGKTFNENSDLVVFDSNSSARTMNPFSMGLRITPQLGYRIGNNLALKITPQWTWDSNSSFDGTVLRIGFHQFNLNMGVSYIFE